MKRHDDYGERIEKEECDLLEGEPSFRCRDGNRGIFSTSFYSGGVFDGRHSRLYNTWPLVNALSALDTQLQAEKARYFVKRGTYDGYLPRYTFGTNKKEIFEKAAQMAFSSSKRNPVGLNPERFVNHCQSCRSWLLESEFGTTYCEQCVDRKPSGKA